MGRLAQTLGVTIGFLRYRSRSKNQSCRTQRVHRRRHLHPPPRRLHFDPNSLKERSSTRFRRGKDDGHCEEGGSEEGASEEGASKEGASKEGACQEDGCQKGSV